MTLLQVLELVILLVFVTSSLYLSWVDLITRRLPNYIMLPTSLTICIVTLVRQLLIGEPGWLIINFGIPVLVFIAFLGIYSVYPKGLGMGDLKAILLIGLVLCRENPGIYFYSVGSSFILGSGFVLFSRIFGTKRTEFPFGPFLLLPAAALSIMPHLI